MSLRVPVVVTERRKTGPFGLWGPTVTRSHRGTADLSQIVSHLEAGGSLLERRRSVTLEPLRPERRPAPTFRISVPLEPHYTKPQGYGDYLDYPPQKYEA
jgi:hypothetical protein